MPLTEKGKEIKGAMEEQYGAEKGEEVFYASKNKGTITGVDQGVQGIPATVPGGLSTAASGVTPVNTMTSTTPASVGAAPTAGPTTSIPSPAGAVSPPNTASPITGDGHRVVATVRDLARAAGAR